MLARAQTDVIQLQRQLALHHEAEFVNYMFETFSIYMKPFLPTGRARAHMDDRSAALTQPPLLSVTRDGAWVLSSHMLHVFFWVADAPTRARHPPRIGR